MKNQTSNRGYKYDTKKEADEIHRRKVNERNKLNKKEYNDYQREYQREYQRKLREKNKVVEQQNTELIQSLLYQQQLLYQQNLIYQQQLIYSNVSQVACRDPNPKIVMTPDFMLEIVDS